MSVLYEYSTLLVPEIEWLRPGGKNARRHISCACEQAGACFVTPCVCLSPGAGRFGLLAPTERIALQNVGLRHSLSESTGHRAYAADHRPTSADCRPPPANGPLLFRNITLTRAEQ